MKLKWICLLLLCVLWLLSGPAGAESAEEAITGYFTETAFVRPEAAASTDYVESIPAYEIITVYPVNEKYASYTSPAGKAGYEKKKKMLPVPEWEPVAEYYASGGMRIAVRNLPLYEARTDYVAKENELLTVNGKYGEFLHVVTENGTEGYIPQFCVLEAEFTPTPIAPVTLCVAEETPLTDAPARGAHRAGLLSPETFYRADAICGNYYVLTADGSTGYVEISRTVQCTWQGEKSRDFFAVSMPADAGWESPIEYIFAAAVAGEDGAELMQPDGSSVFVPGGTKGYVYTACGIWCGADFGDVSGYVRRGSVDVLSGEARLAALEALDLSGGKVQRSDWLDQALSMVEEGNPFQALLNLLTGAEIKSVLPLGIPYFWGGRSYNVITERLPEYTTRTAWQSSPVYYRRGTVYLYGFDCIGFVKCVYSRVGKPIETTLVARREWEYCHAGEHVYCHEAHPLPEDWAEAARNMQAGDFMVVRHPGTHAMLFVGTLRDFGYTEEQLPHLARYLDYPLMMQSGENPYSYFRFQSLIASTSDRRTALATPPDGGVSFCIPGIPPEDAEMIISCHGQTYPCFDVEGCCVTILDFSTVTSYFVSRIDETRWVYRRDILRTQENKTEEEEGSPEIW